MWGLCQFRLLGLFLTMNWVRAEDHYFNASNNSNASGTAPVRSNGSEGYCYLEAGDVQLLYFPELNTSFASGAPLTTVSGTYTL